MAQRNSEETLSFPPKENRDLKGAATAKTLGGHGNCSGQLPTRAARQAQDGVGDDAGAVADGTPKTPWRLLFESRFVDEGIIGEGGMAWVHRVFDEQLGRRLAMKVLKPDCSERTRRRFLQETMITAQLDHPAIVPVQCVGHDDQGQPQCFTMKLIDGENLCETLDRTQAPLRGDALADFVRNMLRVCDAVAFAHSRGVLHCDLKPENLMFGQFGEVYVMDWGVALARNPAALALPKLLTSQMRGVCGTPAYMPPELAQGLVDQIDERCDIFALGGILYEALTLTPPHPGSSTPDVLWDAAWGAVRPPDVLMEHDPPPAELCDIVMKALARNPGDRFASAEELRLALEQFLHTGAWFTRRRFPQGARIVQEGDSGDCAYFLEKGRCRIFFGPDDDKQILREIGPGELFGELALFASDVRVASVECVTDAVLLEITQEAVDRDLPSGSWTRRVLDTLGQRFVEYDKERR